MKSEEIVLFVMNGGGFVMGSPVKNPTNGTHIWEASDDVGFYDNDANHQFKYFYKVQELTDEHGSFNGETLGYAAVRTGYVDAILGDKDFIVSLMDHPE